jgi:hypothetical protein
VRFLIGRRNGEYDGMPKTRNFKVVVHSRGEVKTIDLGAVGDSGSEIEL